MSNICMDSVGGAAFVTMNGKAVADFAYAEGMALALTGANEVGPGVAAGSPVFGIVSKVEVEGNGAIVLGIQTAGFNDKVLMNGTAAVVGDGAYCNDKGLLIKQPAALPAGVVRGVVTAADATAKIATVCF